MTDILVREGNRIRLIITDDDIRSGWANENGQGNREARARSPWCAVVDCDEKDALKLSRAFYETVLALPSCAHYDGTTLSLYCGDAGILGAPRCLAKARQLVSQIGSIGSPLQRVLRDFAR